MFGRGSWLKEVLETVLLTLAIFLLVRLALQNFRVEGQSMSPNLHNGEYILVNKVDYLLHPPQRGDIVVFRAVPAAEPDRDFIKRVIGLPGDTVAIHNSSVYINGNRLNEPYIKTPPDYTFPSTSVPKGDYFVLGDNRNNSDDSHMWASIWLPRSDIIGKAWVSYWPPQDLAMFQSTPSLHLPW